MRPPLLFALSLLQALRPQLGGRFWGASPCEIRPPSITKQLAVVSAAFAAVYMSIAGLLRFTFAYTQRLNAV